MVLRSQSVTEIFGLFPQVGLDSAPNTSEALAEGYLNDSQRIVGDLKVHKIENFFGSDFEFCVISLLVMLKY